MRRLRSLQLPSLPLYLPQPPRCSRCRTCSLLLVSAAATCSSLLLTLPPAPPPPPPSPLLLLGSFAAVLLFEIGQEISILPLQQQLIVKAGSSMKRLRSSQEIGSLVGNLLAALLFPALRQFLPALVLLLPLAVVSSQPVPQASPTPTAIKASNPLPASHGGPWAP